MSLELIKHSANVWEFRDGTTSVLTLDSTANRVTTGGSLKVGNAPAGRFVAGTMTTASASDTVVTGLTTVTACGATSQTDAADGNYLVTASIGNQSGAPAAGSILVKTWKTDGSDPTPAAATSFNAVINWWAWGN